ncbi:MAG: C40 family peptidase [Pseudonocardia sp.]
MSYRAPVTRAALIASAGALALVTALPATAAAEPAAAAPVTIVTGPVPGLNGTAHVDPAGVLPAPDPVATRAASAVKIAMSKIGKPYRYGASGPNAFDCSGLVQWTYKQLGVSLPRTSRAMAGVGKPVAKSDLRPGDLVFFYKPISHVAIYIGNGNIVHASTSGKPVKISKLAGKKFTSARRV